MIKITDENRQKIIYDYAQAVLDGMDYHSMWEYAHYGLTKELEENSNEELEKSISEFYPHLLENTNEID